MTAYEKLDQNEVDQIVNEDDEHGAFFAQTEAKSSALEALEVVDGNVMVKLEMDGRVHRFQVSQLFYSLLMPH